MLYMRQTQIHHMVFKTVDSVNGTLLYKDIAPGTVNTCRTITEAGFELQQFLGTLFRIKCTFDCKTQTSKREKKDLTEQISTFNRKAEYYLRAAIFMSY